MARKGSCPGCEVSYINGVRCHEHGCPEAWKDYKSECKWCGRLFKPEERGQYFCDESCAESYNSNPLGKRRLRNPKRHHENMAKDKAFIVFRDLPPYPSTGERIGAFRSTGNWRIDREKLSPDVMADYHTVHAPDRQTAIRMWKERHKGHFDNPKRHHERKNDMMDLILTLAAMGGTGYVVYWLFKPRTINE